MGKKRNKKIKWNRRINNKSVVKEYKPGKKDESTDVPATKEFNYNTDYYTAPQKPEISDDMRAATEKILVSHSFGEVPEDKKEIHIVVARNGVFEIRENEIGVFIKKKCGSDDEIFGTKPFEGKEGFSFKLPKIPYSMFLQTAAFFRGVMEKFDNAEAHIQLFWNRDKKEYFLHVLKQEVTKAAVDFERDLALEEEHLLVMDMHSHNDMGAFWSGTDDNDEKEERLYGVLGNLDKETFTYKFRTVCGGKFIDLELNDVFDSPHDHIEYPSEWIDKVSKRIYVAPKTIRTTYPKNNYYNTYGGYQQWNEKQQQLDLPDTDTVDSLDPYDDPYFQNWELGGDTVDDEINEVIVKSLPEEDNYIECIIEEIQALTDKEKRLLANKMHEDNTLEELLDLLGGLK